MDFITRSDIRTLVTPAQSPCVSIYMPTHRGGSEVDPIRWRGHLVEVEKRLVAAGRRMPDARKLLEPARQLVENSVFWKNQSDGLAFFLAPGFLRSYRLPIAFTDLAVLGGRFHITPLLPLLAGNGRFYVLAFSQNAVRLLQGTHYGISDIETKSVPKNLAEALVTHDRDEMLTFHSRRTSGGTWGAIFSGHGVGIDDAKDDLLLYFQKIDRALHPLLREEKAPLVLASVDYLQPIYREANTYPHLVAEGLKGNPDRLSIKELHDRAWALVAPRFSEAQDRAAAQYRQLVGTGRTSHELTEIVAAAHEGRSETLFVAEGRHCWGTFDSVGSQVEEHAEEQPGDEDLLNLAAASTLEHDRTVYAVRPDKMPEKGPVAAIYCLPLAKRGSRP
ncbi:MAG: hypothetical protein HY040_05590 [Planctomycetes bacterium]|nr:hypothetical protein [Planctomycetota bacterium]